MGVPALVSSDCLDRYTQSVGRTANASDITGWLGAVMRSRRVALGTGTGTGRTRIGRNGARGSVCLAGKGSALSAAGG